MEGLRGRGLGARAAGLLAAWIGFYLLGLSLAGALLWVPWAQSKFGSGPDPAGVLAGFGGLWILWGMRPRLAARPEEGLALPKGEHRALRDLVDDVARETGHRPFDEIHLIVDANAFTYVQRRFLRPQKTVMGIGLPLLLWLDRAALRSVIAHEMGHHIGGDLRLGPWVHRTRRTIAGALDHLEGSSFLLDLPFALYGDAFLKRSLEVSRAQELQADRVAAKAAGVEAAARALATIDRRAPLWTAFFWTEVVPALKQGFFPPLAEGFAMFEANVRRGMVSDGARPAQARPSKSSEDDTHPTLEERLASLGVPTFEGDSLGSSMELFDEAAAAEDLALRYVLVDPNMKLERIPWSDVPEKVWLPFWYERLKPAGFAFAKLTIRELPKATSSLDEWALHTRTGIAVLSPEASRKRAENTLGIWLALSLAKAGFTIETPPGAPVRAVRGATTLEPFNVVRDLATGKCAAPKWEEECLRLELT